jgi:cell division protein FtsW (lipid II flippase)
MELLNLVVIMLTLAGPPVLMTRRKRWPRSVIAVWIVAVAAMVCWLGASAVYADTLPGGYNPDPFGAKAWWVVFVTLGVVAVCYASLVTRPQRRPRT